jgi:N-acyl-D-aspartate/D-glutamate deacylase
MATISGATATTFNDQIGALEKGRRADVVLLDIAHILEPYLDPDISPVDALVYRAKTRDVDTVMIDGVVVLQGGRFTSINEAEVTRELREQLSRPLEPGVVETRQMVQRLMPYVRQFYGDWQAVGGNPHYRYNSRG